MTTDALLWACLAFVVYPLWLLAGTADFLCHRATGIDRTTGLRESRWHLVQLVLVGVPILAGMAFEITAGVLALMAACLVAHAIAAYADTRVATGSRPVPPVEQHVHAALDALPLVALGIVAVLHWAQLAAVPEGRADWALRWRDPLLPARLWLAVLASAALLALLPAALEWRACRRRERQR